MSNHRARIIGGELKSRVIKTPSCGKLVRPTSDALRELIFNILENSFYLNLREFQVIDVCAGSGAFGLEALSRGAICCSFLDNNPISLRTIEENILSLDIQLKAQVCNIDVNKLALDKLITTKTLLFADPPYSDRKIIQKIFKDIKNAQKEIFCIFETNYEIHGIEFDLVKKKGKSIISFLQKM